MNQIEQLIEELCPSGVQFLTLGELLEKIPRGKRLTKSNLAEIGSIPVFHGGLDPIGFHDEANTPGKTVMVINTGASSGTVGWSNVPFWCSDGCFALPHSDAVLARYLYYCAVLNQHYFVEKIRKAGIPTLAAGSILSLRIPVPPIEVQREIVAILDKFTQLEAELEAELEARCKQYEFYRNELLSLKNVESGVQWMKIENVLRIRNGKDYKHLDEGPVPVFGSGGVMTHVSQSAHPGPSVLIPRKGSLSNLFYVDEPFWTVDTIFFTEIDRDVVYPKFVYHYLKTLDLASLNVAGGVPSLTQKTLNQLPFPVPELGEQMRISEVLDSFDDLVNDISIGLPAEIAARRKQYEYYRDQLLSFKELDVT
jgi:type I restriction enzyme S subunit